MTFRFKLNEMLRKLKEELVKKEVEKQELVNRITQLEYIKITKAVNLELLLKDLDELRRIKEQKYAVDYAITQDVKNKKEEEEKPE